MPFTPFHWGPALLIGLLLFPLLDIPTLFISSVIIDIEPIYLMSQPSGYLHGFFHSYLGSSILGILVAIVVFALRDSTSKIMKSFKLKQKSSFKKILFTSLFGVYSHVFLDSFLYIDIRPFYPLDINPLYNAISSAMIYQLCGISFLFVFILYAYKIFKGGKKINVK